jgi:hypothetical protein
VKLIPLQKEMAARDFLDQIALSMQEINACCSWMGDDAVPYELTFDRE